MGGYKKKSLRKVAYDYMKEQILYCGWVPGHVISERDLCEELGVSKTPIREAIMDLSNEKYVLINPRKSTTVSKISLRDAIEIIEARLVNETYIFKTLGYPISIAQRNTLDMLRTEIESAALSTDKTDMRRFLALDYKFHQTISQMSKNSCLSEICAQLFERSIRIWYIMFINTEKRIAEAFKEHVKIIDYILNADAVNAEKELINHINAFYNGLSGFERM